MSDRATELSPAFHARRRAAAVEAMQRDGLDALVVANGPTMAYLTGFFHITTERPILFVLGVSGDAFAVTTMLEADHLAARAPWLTDLDLYFDYPEADWQWAVDCLRARGLAGRRIGVDLGNLVMSDPIGAYDRMRATLGEGVRNAHTLVHRLRMVKDPEEIAIFRTASEYSDWHVGTVFGLMREGVTEYEVHEDASRATIGRMLRELPRIEDQNGYDRNIIHGRTLWAGGSALPHGPKGTRRLQKPSVVMATYGVGVCHYLGETERSGFFGTPQADAVKIFNVMREAQTAAIEAIRPGVPCSAVHAAARRVIEDAGLAHALRHHTGHGKGIESHEPPFFDAGDHTELMPGMVMSVEPGIYLPGVAGFRHSDTVLVTGSGREVLTHYPRDAQALTFGA